MPTTLLTERQRDRAIKALGELALNENADIEKLKTKIAQIARSKERR